MGEFKQTLAALGAAGPTELEKLYARRTELVTRQSKINADLASGCNRAHSWREWSELQPKLKGEVQTIIGELAVIKQKIREARGSETLRQAGKKTKCYRLLRSLCDALDRVQDEGARLTTDEADALDESAELLATMEDDRG